MRGGVPQHGAVADAINALAIHVEVICLELHHLITVHRLKEMLI
jgi:hypothetical protein